MSRLPRVITTSSDCVAGYLVHLIHHLTTTSINSGHITEWTRKDPVLSKVYFHVSVGWPDAEVDKSLHPYKFRRDELSVLDGCVLWGSRVIVPSPGRRRILDELHDTHPGCSKMKALARNYIWWPKMDADIENTVKSCTTYQENH